MIEFDNWNLLDFMMDTLSYGMIRNGYNFHGNGYGDGWRFYGKDFTASCYAKGNPHFLP